MKGLQVFFHKPLHKTLSGLSPGGAVFPLEYLQAYDLARGIMILRGDYEASESLSSNLIVFESPAPNTARMSVSKDLIARIKDLNNDKILFQS